MGRVNRSFYIKKSLDILESEYQKWDVLNNCFAILGYLIFRGVF